MAVVCFEFKKIKDHLNKDSRWPSTTNLSPNPGGKRHKIQGSCGRDRTTSGARGASLSLSPSAPCLLLVSIRAEKQAFPPSTVQRVKNWQKLTHLHVPTQQRCQVTNVEMYSENCM